MSEDPVPKFKTLKVALLCPRSLENKYSQGNLHAVTGGVASYLLLLANMVSQFCALSLNMFQICL